jgi:mono/diheme cytochrome c family protein
MKPTLPLLTAPPLAGSPLVRGQPEQSILVLLHGLNGPIDGKTYVTQMVPLATNSDDWIASVLSYTRNSFGNSAPFITAKDVAKVLAATLNRQTPPTHEEVKAFGKTAP